MPITPRDASKALLVSLCALPVLLLAGCGGTDAAASDPGPASATSAAPSPTSPTKPTNKAPATSKASDGPAPVHYAGDTKLVTLPAYRLSYRVPAGWITVNGKDLLRRDNPVLTTVAARTGMTIDQLISSLGSHLQAYSISDKGAVDGILDNVNAIGFPAGGLTDAQMRAQFAAIGARPGLVSHVRTPAGQVARLAYVWHTNGLTVHGVALAIDLGGSTASVTVTSHAADSANTLADLVQQSLDRVG
jgi:hypothetical protein